MSFSHRNAPHRKNTSMKKTNEKKTTDKSEEDLSIARNQKRLNERWQEIPVTLTRH